MVLCCFFHITKSQRQKKLNRLPLSWKSLGGGAGGGTLGPDPQASDMAWAAICKEQTFLHPLVAGYACVACGKVCGYVRDKEACLRDARTDISFAVSAQVNQRGGKAHSEATNVYCILYTVYTCTELRRGHRREGLAVQESVLRYENILLSFPILMMYCLQLHMIIFTQL